MYLTQTHSLRLVDLDSLTHWTRKSGQLDQLDFTECRVTTLQAR